MFGFVDENQNVLRNVIQHLSPRQMRLNELYAWFECTQYDERKTDWNGVEVLEGLDFLAVATQGYIPDGFKSIGTNEELPLKFRRPTAPYNLVKVVIERFTSMLFSDRRHPLYDSATEPETLDWGNAAAESGRLWPTMIKARNYGGAMGSVAVGFSFVNGKPKFEAHDPRWLFPTFSDQQELELESLEKKYPYEVERWMPEKARFETFVYWYRRVIDRTSDVVYEPLLDETYTEALKENKPVPWLEKSRKAHNFGECPVVWIQNIAVDGAIDGEPDCAGIYPTSEAIDALLSQANSATLGNGDPTLLLQSDAELGELDLGRKNVVKLNQGDDGKFLEITAAGIKAMRELAKEFKENALEVVSCVIDNNQVGDRATATEVERIFSAMLAKCDILREQYGMKGVVPLMEKMMRAAAKLATTNVAPTTEGGQPVRYTVTLPPRVEKDKNGEIVKIKRTFGEVLDLSLKWGPYFIPSLNDSKQAADAASVAREAKLIDQESATRFVSGHFGIENPRAVLEAIDHEKQTEKDEEKAELDAELEAQLKIEAAAKPPAAPKKV